MRCIDIELLKGVESVDDRSRLWTVVVTFAWWTVARPELRKVIADYIAENIQVGVWVEYRWMGIEVKP